MKTKLEMAHDWIMKFGDKEYPNLTLERAWEYADSMQAEADKRLSEATCKEEWQPDWSQAPEWAKWWVATANQSGKITGGWFYDVKPEFGFGDGPSVYYSMNSNNNVISADSFGYTGDWRDSLRKRPN